MPFRNRAGPVHLTNDERTVLREALDDYIIKQDTAIALAEGIRRHAANAAQWRQFIAQQLRHDL